MLPPTFTTHGRVLVVDDLEINRRVLSRQLTSWRIEHECVNGAADALAALRAAAAAGKPYRLALIDHMMPDVDGLTLGRQIASDRELRAHGDGHALLRRSAELEALPRSRLLRGDGQARGPRAAAAERAAGGDERGAAHDWRRRCACAERRERHAFAGGQFLETTKMTPRRVLLAEDNVVNAKLAVRLLERLGCRVDVASNGHEALKMVQSIPFDIVFMDCQMPEMDGFEATRAIRAWEGASRIGQSPGYAAADRRAHGERDAGRPRALSRGRHGRLHHEAAEPRRPRARPGSDQAPVDERCAGGSRSAASSNKVSSGRRTRGNRRCLQSLLRSSRPRRTADGPFGCGSGFSLTISAGLPAVCP